jgi:2-keto-4-pentenoate hydratase/2-oxohepta-3-ene-1,7-dioic acid hydratase in catechol pathway
MLGFLRRLPSSWEAAQRAFEFAAAALERYDAPDLVRAGVVETRRHVRLCAPVPRPGKIVGVADGRSSRVEDPTLYLEAPSAVIGPEDEILLPPASAEVDYAGGLAAVVGRGVWDVAPDEALAYVAGYCVVNDVTARDDQDRAGRLLIGRSCDTFAPMGPALVTADEIPDPQALAIRTVLSGTPVQNGSTKELAFPVAAIVSFASKRMTLEPGDVILTGTPAGVGADADPPRWLRDGDLVEVEIERIGRLHNYVRRRRPDRVD